MFVLALLLAVVCVSGCSDSMAGRYDESTGIGSMEFRDNGRVYITMRDLTIVGEYNIDGDHIIINGPRGSQVYTRNGEALVGGFGMTFIKQ